ncbi:TetR/AcrR family transcriptional regulator C-terminal domain-containing protein [Actinomadura sp. 3N407]|uniref:TetR/AcrR family transcriptional regulator C-terminal domain-containing protein n=1 Tax=Actinomadura sp. 3N407 TaxID=3457423 RepID=UPI003FCDCE55
MEPRSTRRAGRPSRAILSADAIHRAALDLIDRRGADDFSLAGLARELGVRMPSLYNHVRNRDDVISGMRTLLAAEIDSSPLRKLPWDEALAAWARSYRDAFARHPNTVKLLATTTVRTPAVLDMYEDFVLALEDAGWPTDQTIGLLTALESFVLGSVLDMVAPEQMIDLSADASRHPRLAAAVAVTPRVDRADAAFELGLAAMLSGMRQRLGEIAGSGD